MGLVDNMIEVPITRRNVTYYKNLGYDTPNIGWRGSYYGSIMVRSKDVNKKSKVILLDFVCDCCGKEFKRTPESYYKRMDLTGDDKSYCQKCAHVGAEETMMARYGVRAGCDVPGADEKRKATCLERYGTEYVMQNKEVKEKSKATCVKKYGVDSCSKLPERREASKRLFMNNGLINSSRQQNKIGSLVGGRLNEPFHGFYLDVLFEDWLDIEYDGSGHDLRVKRGSMTREQFDKMERIRYAAIHSFGLKTLTIIGNANDVLPDDNMLYFDIMSAVEDLRCSDAKSIVVDYSKLC